MLFGSKVILNTEFGCRLGARNGLKWKRRQMPHRNVARVSVRCQSHDDRKSNLTVESTNRREILLRGVSFAGCYCALCGKERNKSYDSFFAYSVSHGMDHYEELVEPKKKALFEKLTSQKDIKTILEMGIGAGPNIKYYAPFGSYKVTGVDPNPEMKQYALKAAKQQKLDDFEFVESYGEEIPLESGSFDAIVCTLVLCSVSDPVQVLQEIKRLLKPGGRLFFIEHVAAPKGSVTWAFQKAFNPLQQLLADGCHLDRNTLSTIESVGFKEVEAESFDVEGLSILAPHIAGMAVA